MLMMKELYFEDAKSRGPRATDVTHQMLKAQTVYV